MPVGEDPSLRRWSVSVDLEVDLDGPYVIFKDGQYATVDGDYACGVLPEAEVRCLPLSGLHAALGAIAEDDSARWLVDVWLIDTDPPNRIHDVEPIDGVALHSPGRGGLCALIDIGLPLYVDEEFEAGIEDLLAPMMARVGGRAKAPVRPPESFFASHDCIVLVEFVEIAGRTVGDLLDLALATQAFLTAARNGEFNRTVARDLLRAGQFNSLLGQPESNWLEVKSQLWALDQDSGKAEAAKDLSALANATGGLLVIPAKTDSDAGRDVIAAVKTLPLDRFSEAQLRDTIAHWTFPPLRGIEVDMVDGGSGRGQVLITVPAHHPEDWPHLVVSPDDSAFTSASVAAYVRDGDKNRALTAAQLHKLMRDTG